MHTLSCKEIFKVEACNFCTISNQQNSKKYVLGFVFQTVYTKPINQQNKSINECWASENLGLYNLLTRTYASSIKQEKSLSSSPQFSQLTIIIKPLISFALLVITL